VDTLVVQIGDLVLYKDASMKEILRERETLRKFFRYVPDSKTWTLDIKRFDHTDGQVKELSSYLSSLFKVSVDEINYALNEEIKRQRENLEDEKRRKLSQFLREGKFAVIPTEFLDEKRREIARMFCFSHSMCSG